MWRIVTEPEYRRERLGEYPGKYGPIAQYLGRSFNSVKVKCAELQLYYQHEMALAMQQAAATGEQHMQYMDPAIYTDPQLAHYGYMNGYYDPATGQELDPVMLHQIFQQNALPMEGHCLTVTSPSAPTARARKTNDPIPKNDRVFWKPEECQKLLLLVQDAAYREQLTGVSEINWDLIAKELGRGRRSVMRKYDNLKGCADISGVDMSLPENDGKKWSKEEMEELVQLVENDAYRYEKLAIEKVDWRILGHYFGRSYESVSYKYSYVRNTGQRQFGERQRTAKAKHDTSYKEMAIWALGRVGGQGTSSQLCDAIEDREDYARQLDRAIVSGKKTLQRWRHGVRSALNAFRMFVKTELVDRGEVVWQLDETELEADRRSVEEKAARVRAKPLSGAQRRKIKKEREWALAAAAEEAGLPAEQGAQQALATMAQHRESPGAKRKKESDAVNVASKQWGRKLARREQTQDPQSRFSQNGEVLQLAASIDPMAMLQQLQMDVPQGEYAFPAFAEYSMENGIDPNVLQQMDAASQYDPAVLQQQLYQQHR